MNIVPRIGHLLISFDPDVDRVSKPEMKFDIIIPAHLQRKARVAFCHFHRLSDRWDEVDLTSKRVVVDRWSARPFVINHEGEVHEFYTISQWAVLAVVNEEEGA